LHRFYDFRFGHWFDRSRSDIEFSASPAAAFRIAARSRQKHDEQEQALRLKSSDCSTPALRLCRAVALGGS
jgi:hypothetical protein